MQNRSIYHFRTNFTNIKQIRISQILFLLKLYESETANILYIKNWVQGIA